MKSNHTFVVCAYKESEFLEECILSLLAQSVKSDIIITTSTPNERIKAMADKYNLKLYINDVAEGIGADWNYGLSRAGTRYVTLAHQDDVYEPDFAKKCIRRLRKNSDALICFTNYGELRNGKRVTTNKLLKIKRALLLPYYLKYNIESSFIRRMDLSLGNPISCPSVTYDVDNIEGIIFEKDMKSNVDWQAWEQLSEQSGRFIFCRDILMYHRIHEGSETSNVLKDNGREDEDYEMFCKFWPERIARILTRFYGTSEKSNNV